MLPDRSNMYSDDDGPSKAPDAANPDKASENQTALIPKTLFGENVKPGDEVKLKCVSVHGDEALCEKCDYTDDDKDEHDETPPTDDGDYGGKQPEAPGGLSSMLSD